MSRPAEPDYTLLGAVISAGAMIAFQIGGKAARDALFLSNFPVTALPAVLVASAAFSIVSVFATARMMSAMGPGRFIPYAFSLSSILLLAEWSISSVTPRAAALALYLHMASFGAVLVSGFWLMISELFDPRAAKVKIGRIAAAGTVGGMLGGVIAERTGAMVSASAMLPVLATLHLLCAGLNLQLGRSNPAVRSEAAKSSSLPVRSGLKVLSTTPYLKSLAWLILLGTVAETLLDYVLKTQAAATYGRGDQLIRFFGLFYTGVSVATFLVQSAFSRYSLQHLGLAGTISTMPLAVVVGGLGSLIYPGFYSIGLARGGQSVLRSSLFRSAYELLYAPVTKSEKRAAKTIVDVGFDRLGDALGGGLIRGVLALGLAATLNSRLLMAFAVFLGSASLVLTRRLGAGYVSTLQQSLLDRAAELDLIDIEEKMTRATIFRTFGSLDAAALRGLQDAQPPAPSPARAVMPQVKPEPWIQRMIDLGSRDLAVVRNALLNGGPLDPVLIAPVIRLLARDETSDDAVRILQTVAASAAGQLTDALLNPDEDFAVRRRVPRALASFASSRTVDGLLRGLRDTRFEVRFSCGRALSRVCSLDETLRPEPQIVYAACLEEIRISERLLETPRILDRYEDHPDSPSTSLWDSTNIRLEHIFRLLALSLPSEPLHIAFQALHTDDSYLRGTALEYLESILPSGVREHLWQFLEGPSRAAATARPTDLVLKEMMQSRHRIALLTNITRRH